MADADDASRVEDVRGKRQLSEMEKRRKENNRKCAREFRRRKKEELDRVIRECETLEEENRKLRLQLRVGMEAEMMFDRDQKQHVAEFQTLLQRGATEMEFVSAVQRFVGRFTDVGLDRTSAVEFHLKQVARLLTDDLFTAVCAQALIGGKDLVQDQSTADTGKALNLSGGLFPEGTSLKTVQEFLKEYLSITPQQAQAFREESVHYPAMQDSVAAPLETINAVRRKRGAVVLGLMILLTEVKTQMPPSQAAKYMSWTCQNAACMHMLNELWAKIYKRSSTGQRVSAFDVASNVDDMFEFDGDDEADGIDNNSDFDIGHDDDDEDYLSA